MPTEAEGWCAVFGAQAKTFAEHLSSNGAGSQLLKSEDAPEKRGAIPRLPLRLGSGLRLTAMRMRQSSHVAEISGRAH